MISFLESLEGFGKVLRVFCNLLVVLKVSGSVQLFWMVLGGLGRFWRGFNVYDGFGRFWRVLKILKVLVYVGRFRKLM